MQQAHTLILVDGDSRRRATLSHSLSSHGVHVEPFETVAELAQSWPRSGTVVIHDSEGSVADLIARMAQHGEWYPIVAFAEEPVPSRIVRAMLDGAVDYITWPFRPKRCSPRSSGWRTMRKGSVTPGCARPWRVGGSKS